ncbi:unnamed protein product, partial [Coregonus sp. 'balchen']
MITIFSLQGAVLAIVSVASLSVFFTFCLWCRRKTITRPNQIVRDLPPTPVDPIPALVYQNVNESTNAETDGSDYENSEFLAQVKMGLED